MRVYKVGIDRKENIWLVMLGLAIGGLVVFMALWSLTETDPQYRQPPDYITTNTESEASND